MKFSFTTRIALYTGLCVVAVSSALFGVWYFGVVAFGIQGARLQQIDEAIHFLEFRADGYRRLVEYNLEERRGDALVLSENVQFSRALAQGDLAAVQRQLTRVFARLQRAYPDRYRRFELIDPATMTILASSDPGRQGRRAEVAAVGQAAQPGISEMIVEPAGETSSALLILRQVQELDADGAPSGRILAVMSLEPELRTVLSTLTDTRDSITGFGFSSVLYDHRGRIIARRAVGGEAAADPVPQVAHGFEGVQIEEVGERRRLAVYRHLPQGGQDGWTLALYQDIDETLASLNREARNLIVLGLSLTVLALVLIQLSTRRVTRPLRALAETADRLGAGDFAARANVGAGDAEDEIRKLATSFNTMAVQIGRDRRQLEEQVRLRTSELVEERNAVQRYLDIAGVMLLVLDRSGRIVMVNRAGEALLGRARAVLVGTDWFDPFIPADRRDEVRAVFRQCMDGRQTFVEFYENPVVTGRGETRLLSWHNALLRDAEGHITGVLSSAEDITERQRAAAELARAKRQVDALNATLEQRVADAVDELEATHRELLAAHDQLTRAETMASLGRMVAVIAHELNTPIGNSRLAASTLREQAQEFVARTSVGVRRSDLDRLLASIDTGTRLLDTGLQRAAHLISSFKQVAVDQTSALRRRFALDGLVDEIATTLEPGIRRSGCTLTWSVEAGLEIDSYPGPLGQVLINLIDNATRHAYLGCEPGAIEVAAKSRGDGEWLLTVRDHGIGIPPVDQKRIFEPFYTTQIGHGGTGLGLSIAYNLVTAVLGGQLSVSSREGDGACFTAVLPKVAPAPTPTSTGSGA